MRNRGNGKSKQAVRRKVKEIEKLSPKFHIGDTVDCESLFEGRCIGGKVISVFPSTCYYQYEVIGLWSKLSGVHQVRITTTAPEPDKIRLHVETAPSPIAVISKKICLLVNSELCVAAARIMLVNPNVTEDEFVSHARDAFQATKRCAT